jgi:hypothetical protein
MGQFAKTSLKTTDTTNDMGHWEYTELKKQITNVELFMKIFSVVQRETNIKNGHLFRLGRPNTDGFFKN